MLQKVVVTELCIVNPSGRTGGDHRKLATILDSAEKLGSLFHNGKVCGIVGIEYLLKAESAKGGNHLACYVCADAHTEALAECNTD